MPKLIALLLVLPLMATAQNDSSFSDFHIHVTYKHFYRDVKSAQEILSLGNNLPALQAKYGGLNNQMFHAKPRAFTQGAVSHGANYNQSDAYELRYSRGSVLCTSLYPYERQFTADAKKRFISHHLVTKISKARLRKINEAGHSSFDEFMAEYRFAQAQQTTLPGTTQQLLLARDHNDLQSIVNQGNSAMVLSIEGGHVLYGPKLSGTEKRKGEIRYVRNWSMDQEDYNEVFRNIATLKNLDNRVFFITLSHFTDNRFSGYCKSIDRPGISREFLRMLSAWPLFRKSFFTKFGEGIHGEIDRCKFKKFECGASSPYTYCDTIVPSGKRIITALLTPDGRYNKPILIDVKHMDIRARFEYYDLVAKLSDSFGRPIPIIAGHVAVSGENKWVAMATGLNPNFDRYEELNNPLKFYRKDSADDANWKCFTASLHDADRLLYFDTRSTAGFNPYENHINRQTAGWFNPWSINLCDEEIAIICQSDGIIGLNFDERILGAYMKHTKKRHKNKSLQKQFDAAVSSIFPNHPDITFKQYVECEPLLRNLFYVVDRSGITDSTAWNHVAIGSDFDGLIDPIDLCQTAAFIPSFRKKFELALPIFWSLNQGFYQNRDLLFGGSISYARIAEKFFYENGKRFILAHF